VTAAQTDRQRVLRGIGVSAGSASGPAVVVGLPPQVPADEPASTDVAADWERISAALTGVAETLESRAKAAGGAAAEILGATALMARDPSLGRSIHTALEAGSGPATAVHTAIETVCAQFTAIGGYLAERTTDLRDVGSRVIARVLGVPEPTVPELTVPSVLIAHDLAPADTALLSPVTTLAIVTELGGPTSHTAILAAQLGIPAVVHAPGATSIEAGTVIAVDGSAGTVTLGPTAAEQQAIAERRGRRAALLATHSGAGRTRDGHAVNLLANIGTVGDAEVAAAADVEGVGLFRTEFLFLDRTTAPTVAEQTAAYSAVLAGFSGRYVTVRTLDAGADKPLPFADLGEEENPALGVRGLRLSQRRTDLLDSQLEALAAAAESTAIEVKVMAPMVATPAEARWFAERARSFGLATTGVMIEVPAAALRAEQVLAEVEFVSLGTNDLAQYTLAADRLQGELADLLDPWQPALLDLVAMTASAAARAGKRAGVCGEAAGDPLLALVLTGLGVTSLSMAAGKVAAVRYALAEHDLEVCREMAAAARASADPAGARAAVRALCAESVEAIL
jgi:phosphotransferase system enzyme I (PtsI)